jgi:hypothetical protein
MDADPALELHAHSASASPPPRLPPVYSLLHLSAGADVPEVGCGAAASTPAGAGASAVFYPAVGLP